MPLPHQQPHWRICCLGLCLTATEVRLVWFSDGWSSRMSLLAQIVVYLEKVAPLLAASVHDGLIMCKSL